jgi:pre-rRNA-processing protein TSR1
MLLNSVCCVEIRMLSWFVGFKLLQQLLHCNADSFTRSCASPIYPTARTRSAAVHMQCGQRMYVWILGTLCYACAGMLTLLLLLYSCCFQDPLAIVDLAKAAEVLLLLLPGQEGAVTVDAAGSSCLTVLRAMGLPSTIAVVLNQQQHGTNAAAAAAAADAMGIDGDEAAAGGAAAAKGSSAELKRRSAAKKRAEKALQQHLPGDTKLLSGDNTQDMQQLLRTLADSMPQLPVWRRQRPYVMVQQASFQLDEQQQQQQQQQDGQQQQHQQQLGQLRLTGYVRAQGLSANQLITVPGAGDFRILRIEGPHDPAAPVAQQRQQQQKRGGAAGAMDMDMQDAAGAAAAAGPVLALPDPEQQEALVRENEPDPLDGEFAALSVRHSASLSTGQTGRSKW